MHSKRCPKGGRMKMTIETTSYPANPHKVLVRLINDALSRGRRRSGMSKKSIQNRIEQTYHCRLGTRFEKELTKSLKRLVRSHHLERVGHRYKLTGRAPRRGGWRLNEALPVNCRCNRPPSRSCSKCPRSQRGCKPYSGIRGLSSGSSRRQKHCSKSRSRSRSRSMSRRRSRSRRGSSRSRRAVGRRRSRGRARGRRSMRKGKSASTGSRHSSRQGRSRSRSRIPFSRSASHSRLLIRGRSRSRGRSRTRRSRSTYSTRSTSASSRKRRRIQYTFRTRSTSRSTNGDGVRSPSPQELIPEPKLDVQRGMFEPGLMPPLHTAASTSHSSRRDSPYPYSPAPSSVTVRGRTQSPRARGRGYHRSSSVSARSRSRSPSSSVIHMSSSRTGVPYLPSLKPIKPALRHSSTPQSPNPASPNTLTPKSMVQFLTQ